MSLTDTSSLSPDVWLITGASSGFGKRLAISILARGDRVIATARSVDRLQPLIDGLKPEAVDRLKAVRLELTDGEDRIKTVIDEAAALWGRLDVVINNAGVGYPGLTEEGGTKQLRRQFDANVFGVLDVTAAALPHIRKSKHGRVVVIGSRSAWRAETPGLGPYAASKAAVHAVTESLMGELAPFKIKVLLVEPGAFRTEGIYGQTYFNGNPISDYDQLRAASMAMFKARPGSEKGDPEKGVEVIVDVVRGEGVAAGRPWPSYLFLGEDAEQDVRAKCAKVLSTLDQWVDVTRAVNFDTTI